MSRRRSIFLSAFVAWLAAYPIVLYVAGRHFRDSADFLGLSALVFVVACAIALRSLIITGALAALFGSTLGESVIMCDYFPTEQEELERALIYPTVGALAGLICEVILVSRNPSVLEGPRRWITRLIRLVATVILAVVFGALAATTRDMVRWSHPLSADTAVIVGVLSLAWAAVALWGIRLNET
ncbi:MAG TPA: hypothetical protein VEI07_20255 [Planctomycetaceae bacterium]|nr:hypothetical protein [Planctomycetaceae bacterium]